MVGDARGHREVATVTQALDDPGAAESVGADFVGEAVPPVRRVIMLSAVARVIGWGSNASFRPGGQE